MKGNRNTSSVSRLRAAAVVSLVLTAIGGMGAIHATSDCVTVAVPARLVLPDGTTHDASRLTLCTAQDLSPVTRLHELSLDGNPVGMLVSRAGTSEGPARATPIVLFRRLASGALGLVGYAIPKGRQSRTFLMQSPPQPRIVEATVSRAARASVAAVEAAPPHASGSFARAASQD